MAKFKSHDGKTIAAVGSLIVFRGDTYETDDEAEIKALENAQDVERATDKPEAKKPEAKKEFPAE